MIHLTEILEIKRLMPIHFDAHDFILAFIRTYPHSYFRILGGNMNDVNITNAQIGNFLKQHSSDLCIESAGEVESLNIMSNISSCMSWKKL